MGMIQRGSKTMLAAAAVIGVVRLGACANKGYVKDKTSLVGARVETV